MTIKSLVNVIRNKLLGKSVKKINTLENNVKTAIVSFECKGFEK